MGIRQSSSVKQQYSQSTKDNKISLSNFTLKSLLSSQGNIHNWLVEQSDNIHPLVMKIIPKVQLYNDKKIKAYIKQLFLMVSLPHQFLLQPYYAFQDLHNLYLVIEYVAGGDLCSQLKQHSMREEEAKNMVACIFIALNYLHSHNIIHTNLNPNNIYIDSEGYIKLYGLHCCSQQGDFQSEITEYMAPEVLLREQFGCEADFYSVGLILYEVMANQKLLENPQEELIEFIVTRKVSVKKSNLSEGWSLDAADFINKLIQKNPIHRLGYYGFQEVKQHKWMQGVQWHKLEERAILNTYIPKQNREIHASLPIPRMDNVNMIQQAEFQNLFSLFYYRWDQEVMIDFIKQHGDPFVTLGLPVCKEKLLIKQAYKQMARIHHPDKNMTNTQDEFIKVKSAYDFLTANLDAYMEYAAARQHRNIEMIRQSAEVRGFADDLMKREQKFEKEKERAEELRNMKIREEIDRMKKEEQQEKANKQKLEDKQLQFDLEHKESYRKLNSVKVYWKADSAFTEELLELIFKSYGPIKEVKVKDNQTKGTIWYHTTEAANNAVSSANSDQIKVKFTMKKDKRDKLQQFLRESKEKLNRKEADVFDLSSDTLQRISNFYNKDSKIIIDNEMDFLRRQQERQKMMDDILREEMQK